MCHCFSLQRVPPRDGYEGRQTKMDGGASETEPKVTGARGGGRVLSKHSPGTAKSS